LIIGEGEVICVGQNIEVGSNTSIRANGLAFRHSISFFTNGSNSILETDGRGVINNNPGSHVLDVSFSHITIKQTASQINGQAHPSVVGMDTDQEHVGGRRCFAVDIAVVDVRTGESGDVSFVIFGDQRGSARLNQFPRMLQKELGNQFRFFTLIANVIKGFESCVILTTDVGTKVEIVLHHSEVSLRCFQLVDVYFVWVNKVSSRSILEGDDLLSLREDMAENNSRSS